MQARVVVCLVSMGVFFTRQRPRACLAITCGRTYVLVWDDLHALHVSSGLEDLLQDVLGHARVKTSNVKGSFVGFGRSSADLTTSTGRGEDVAKLFRDRIVVLRDVERRDRRGRHVATRAILIGAGARSLACGGVGRQRRNAGIGSVGHCCSVW